MSGVELLRSSILDLVGELGLQPGERIPTEAEIADRFGASRPKVREALRELESLGFVRSRQGSGRILLDRSHHTLTAMLGNPQNKTPGDLLDALNVRHALEVSFLSAAMRTLDPAALAEMRVALERMRTHAEAGEPFPHDDKDFHDALFRGVRNELLNKLLTNFWELFASVDPEMLSHHEDPAQVIHHHENILNALSDRDYAMARFHLDAHFVDSYTSLRQLAAS
jgi:DNA-binding FadR family transcriptional regulator